mgnify:CR=1 FL=1
MGAKNLEMPCFAERLRCGRFSEFGKTIKLTMDGITGDDDDNEGEENLKEIRVS